MAESARNSSFWLISRRFSSSMNALRRFTDRFEPLAAEHDRSACEKLRKLFNDCNVQYRDEAGKVISNEAVDEAEGDDQERKQKRYVVIEENQEARKLRDFSRELAHTPPVHGSILRASALITLVSYLDVVVGQLVRQYYTEYPNALPSDDRNISLADLRKLGDVKAAEEHLLEREIDSLLRGSFEDQLNYLTKRLKIETDSLSPFLDEVIETIQRRHLLVHNGGDVNQSYIDHVSEKLLEGITLGSELDTTAEYLRNSIDRVHLVGLILIHLGWRKWFPAEAKIAGGDINEHGFYALENSRFELAQRIAKFGLTLDPCEDATRLNLVLNLAQAHKWMGDEESMKKVLEAEDWSASRLRYRLALSALRDDAEEFFRLLPTVASTEELQRTDIEEWPIFMRMREHARFEAALAAAYDESSVPTREAA